MSVQDEADFEVLLQFLKVDRGFDFTGYKRPSLMRRVGRRMTEVGCRSYSEYLDYLQVHPEEFPALFDTVLINVTRFFRDAPTWNLLLTSVLPKLVAARGAGDQIRAWVAGCASGEEAYSLAIALAEVIGPEWPTRLKVYATDVDEEALATARQAIYRRKELTAVSDALLDRYFQATGDSFTVRKELRGLVIFGRHDLVSDTPISRIDVLSCRNTLMYFNAETQKQILHRFRFALNESGVLLLGRAEMLLAYTDVFAPVDLKHRIFAKVAAEAAATEVSGRPAVVEDPGPAGEHWVMRAALDASPTAQLVVDDNGRLAMVNEAARVLFGVGYGSVGRPFSNLDVSFRPVELRSVIDRVTSSRQPAVVGEVTWPTPMGETGHFEVQVLPLVLSGETLVGTSITFVDVTRSRTLRDELEHAHRDLETAYAELQSTNEELETTNEELQSTVEELETTNEELQSTNSELETMNEELQSTNEQLQAMNDELRERTRELHTANVYLESILAGVRAAVVVLDDELTVTAWNRGAEELLGLRAAEARGRRLIDLDVALPLDELAGHLRGCAEGGRAVERTVQARAVDGRTLRCRVSCQPLGRGLDGAGGAVLFLEQDGPDGGA